MSGTFHSRGGPDDITRIGSFAASQTTPFYVTVGYDNGYLRAQYLGIFLSLGLCWFVLTAAMVAAAVFIHRLDELSQQSRLEIVNSAVAERQKLSADMHDSIGASLAALLAYLTTENVNIGRGQAADRRSPDGIALSGRQRRDLRRRSQSAAEQCPPSHGQAASNSPVSNCTWQAGDLPQIEGLTARDALTVKLILMEALSNVLHHSRTEIGGADGELRSSQPRSISIAVRDDGCGFDPVAARAGRGLANMRRRIASISTGAAIFIDSSPGGGTTVRSN